MDTKRVAVGKILTTHGHRGEVKIWPWTDFPQRFRPGTKLWLRSRQGSERVTITSSRPHGRHLILKFAEIPDMAAAERLRNAILEVDPWEVEPLPPGRYYVFQLIDCEVFTVEGEFLGKLKDVQKTGANDVFVVVTREGREILLPALKKVVKEIDIHKKIIKVKLLPGLLD
ncbi:MAG: ribosome maturation factor RimM [Thermanaeromonas sp.]|uniref:ribosome maturation factor RimM n=1 Tax=Thermanaeromonas sp. TaxID=2003697 RepID=UPI00243A1C05|nr:ribosome maturation factor RimM [Thermanaeromonas sp.]MCG0277203.1 ribosome maturation factor RimM [Thermanaeromonas sp.]